MANVSMTLPTCSSRWLSHSLKHVRISTDRCDFQNAYVGNDCDGGCRSGVTFANVFTIIQPVVEAGDWDAHCG